MKLTTSTFTSKVARRAFLLFIACALFPVSILGVLSYRQVTTELRQQSERRLRQASKAVGLELHKRILAVETALRTAGHSTVDTVDESDQQLFLGISLHLPDGSARILSGDMVGMPTLTTEQSEHLRSGHSVFSIKFDETEPPHFFMSRLADPLDAEKGVLHGRVNPAYLWVVGDEAALERDTRLVVLDEFARPVISSLAAPVSDWARTEALHGPAGQFTWSNHDERYLASYWSLFLKNRFECPKWIIVLNRPVDDIVAPIAAYHRTFLLVSFLSLLVVLWLSIVQIRKILDPLARLQEATSRISSGRLDTRVEVRSRDEFETLACSFNQMAGQLGRQFDALSMQREITAALSRSESTGKVLHRCAGIIAADLKLAVAGIWMLGSDRERLEQVAMDGPACPQDELFRSIRVGEGEIGRVVGEARPYASNALSGERPPTEHAWLQRHELVAFVGHPLVIDGRVEGVAAVFSTQPIDVMDIASLASVAGEIAQCLAQRRAAEALQQSEEQVRQLQKTEAIGRLAGGIAHDFNNLLTVIMGYTQILLEDTAQNDPRNKGIQVIEKTAVRAAQLTQQLLAFSRKQVLAPTLLDLNEVIQSMSSILERLIGASIKFVFKPAPGGALAKLDRGQLEQVLVNLVVNARDAMPNGGQITIETSVTDVSGSSPTSADRSIEHRHARLRVTDTGTGMDAVTQAKIFEPFFTTKEQGKGTGLGLATVSGIVAQSGGTIHVESELGKGTAFTLLFPLATGTLESNNTAALPPRHGDETILLVEDEHEVRSLLEHVLTQFGYTILSAASPSDALRIAENHVGPVHLLLTDMVMPEMSGAVLSARISALRPETAVLQMSGYSDYCNGGNGTPGTFLPFLQKPFTPDGVARAVRSALDAGVVAPS